MQALHHSPNLKLKKYKEAAYYGEFIDGRREGKGIMMYLSGLYIGDDLVASNKKLLKDLNIKHIIVVGLELKQHHPENFNYRHPELFTHFFSTMVCSISGSLFNRCPII